MRTLWLKLYRYSCGAGLILKAKKGDDSIIGEDAKGSSDLHKLSGFLFFGGGESLIERASRFKSV